MKTPKEKYHNDQDYRVLVDVLVSYINSAKLTPSEIREACVLASIIYEERRLADCSIHSKTPEIPQSVNNAFNVMSEWLDKQNDLYKDQVNVEENK